MAIADQTIEWRLDTLPRATKKALILLAKMEWIGKSHWYLAGGTALALHAGHRQSQDLDFFTRESNFSFGKLIDHFNKTSWKTTIAREGTVYGELENAKISFIAYPFFYPKKQFDRYGGIRILSPEDIAVMKIIAVSQRGRKRDFIDLYWHIKNRENLIEILNRLPEEYPTVAHDFHHILKSLMYFADADSDPMPKLFFKATWPEVKKYFLKEVPAVTRKLLKL